MSSSALKLSNLTALVDFNGFQSDGSTIDISHQEAVIDRWSSFGWNVVDIDGHCLHSIHRAFHNRSTIQPNVIIVAQLKAKEFLSWSPTMTGIMGYLPRSSTRMQLNHSHDLV